MTEAAGAGNWTSRHHRFTPHSRYLSVALACLSLTALAEPVGAAIAFKAGNLVVYRTAAPNSKTQSVALDEYDLTGAYVYSHIVPANKKLVASGAQFEEALSEGLITRSPNGLFLSLTGYDADTAVASATVIGSASTKRLVARVDASGTVDLTTALTDAYIGNGSTAPFSGIIRSAATVDGSALYTGGRGSPDTFGGVRSTNLGAATSSLKSGAYLDARQVNVFSGNLYFSTAATTGPGLYTLGTVPSLVAPTRVVDTGPWSSPNAFFFANPTTVYIADDRSTGGILKYTSSDAGQTFTLAYHLIPSGPVGVRGLIGIVSGSSTVLYATTAETSANKLVAVTDTGASSTFTTLATAPANTVFRGVALAPTATPSAVNLMSFTATRYTSSIWLNWRTGLEVDNLGFNVYREVPREGGGRRVRLNGALIAGSALRSGSGGGCSYAWPDMAGDTGGARYWLEDVDTHGTSTWHGPVTAGVGRGTGAAQRRSPLLGETALMR